MRNRLLVILLYLVIGMVGAVHISAQGAPEPINDALADLNEQLGTNYTLNDFNWFWEQQTYDDTSLGCPVEGETYSPGPIVAYRFEFDVEGNIYDYRVSADRSILVLCSVTPVNEILGEELDEDPVDDDYLNPLCQQPPEGINYMPTRLTVDIQARVAGGLPNRVRAEPNTQAAQTGEIPGGGIFTVLNGPTCDAEGYLWWQVDFDGFVGWTAEGRNGEYFLEPLPPASLPTLDSLTPENTALITEISRLQGNYGTAFAWAQNFATDAPTRLVAVGGLGAEGAIVYDMSALTEAPRFLNGTQVLTAVDFGRDSRLALFGSFDGTIRLWDIGPGAPLVERAFLVGHATQVSAVAFSPDGTTLASSGGQAFQQEDREDNQYAISLWNVDNVALVGALRGHTDSVTEILFTPDNAAIISASLDGTVRVWSVADRTNLTTLELSDPVTSLALSPDGVTVAIGVQSGSIALWNRTTGEFIATLSNHIDSVNGLAFNPEGTLLVSGGADGQVLLWDVSAPSDGLTPAALTGHNGAIEAVAFNPEGTLISTLGEDNTLRLWGVNTNSVG